MTKVTNHLSTHAATVVWAGLIGMTALSWLLGTASFGPMTSGEGRSCATVGILLVSFFKARLVFLHFMEVRTAPLPLRLACEIWTFGTASSLVLLYLNDSTI
jgi:hypothetical protein